MPKTIILAIFTLCLAVATLVTNVVRPYAGGVDSTASAVPAQVMAPIPVRAPLRAPGRGPVLQASTTASLNAI
ncbi:MAG: hypothetical protein Q7T81_06025 [Pseudolabrys sp.]|nr:hypothetical protein [Pseudolabrys sp.]